jgi:hypothetical protein
VSATVCAVVAGSRRLDLALAAQRRQPESIIRTAGPLDAGLRHARESGAEWVWVLDGSAAPQPEALLALLQALDRVERLPEPQLLAGVVLEEDGSLDPTRAAWYRRGPREQTMAAGERRLLPIRAAAGPVLVRSDVVDALAPPRRALAPPGGVLEWTARLLRARVGYWVPDSESLALASGRNQARSPRTAAALLLGGAFAGRERVRVGLELLGGVAGPLRARASEAPPRGRS